MLLLGFTAASARAQTGTTLLVYMCGADIQADACADIREMCRADVGEDVNIVVLAGGARAWDIRELKCGTRNLVEIRGGGIKTVSDWGRASMGSGDSLFEFLQYGLTQYPADRTALVLWNHGAGSEGGICFDDTTEDQDGLTLNEINDALYDLNEAMGNWHIDILGCDACMMATYEMAAMLSYYDIDYFIASEENVPYTGLDYEAWLNAVAKDPGMDDRALCRTIIDSYFDALHEMRDDTYLTMSAVELSKITPLQETMERFAAALLEEIEGGNIADVRRGRSRMYTFGSYVDGSWDMVDMGAMLDAYARFDTQLASQARKQLGDAVAFNRQTSDLEACSGLSVLIPQDTRKEFGEYFAGMDLSYYMPNWIGFVKSYAGALAGGSYSFSPSTPQQLSGTGFFSTMSGMLASGERYDWDSGSGEYVASQPSAATVSAGEGDYAFTASLTAEDMQYLDYVEGMLMMDVTDAEAEGYVDFGLMRNNLIDWQGGSVYSLFDGTWPILGEQPVPLYDQISNERGRRSLIPVKLNGEATYLVVEFTAGAREGRIVGANAGYDENGLPIRRTTRLREGDVIVPVYTLYYDGGGEDMAEAEFDGDEIIWRDGMTVEYLDLRDEDEPTDMLFCFVLNDVFGDYTMTDPVAFQM